VKYQFIKDHRGEFRVIAMCRVLHVPRSGYYRWLTAPRSRREQDNHRLLTRIRAIHASTDQNYGALKTWRALRDSGESCGRHRVARLRQMQGIEAKRMRRFRAAYAARNNAPAAPNLLDQDFQVSQPDRAWAGDITFVPTRRGWLYLAVVLDLYSRRVIGWSMSDRINQQLVIDALMMAIRQRRPVPGLIHHSDQGIQYAGGAYRAILKAHDMLPSMSRKGNCYDNACVESFFSSLKNELIFHRDFYERDEARLAIFNYIEVFYNRQRSHQTLDYRSPVRYEEMNGVA
jgi:putative transposase